jgi:hypothetical protein
MEVDADTMHGTNTRHCLWSACSANCQ